ncbi:MAG: single-stranded DNA-binding protein [Ignavibacteriales bacterium CG12_big_fil_rev_8_21_14_0_65_30_8]|nr:MAG: single-stranded DNA-binding protein [Ignavibacteriales bacterium CG12_big_fil_rev_8_21_14_0_65_30_8]
MSFSLNKIMLIGNLGKDAETRFTTNNLSVTTFSLATTRSYKDKEGAWQNETTWHNLVGYNLSDYYKENLKKGKKFYVEGRISKRDYTDKEGVKKYVTDTIVEKLIPLDSSGSGGNYDKSNSDKVSEPDADVSEDNEDLPF